MTRTDSPEDTARDLDDLAPGTGAEENQSPRSALASYTIGLALSVVLTVAAFYVLHSNAIWRPAIPMAVLALGVAQIGVHLVFFLHITTAPDNTNNILALAFGVLIVGLVVAGSLWIMAHLNHNMVPMSEVMRMQR